MKRILAIVIGCWLAALTYAFGIAQAQDVACPVAHVCVDYEGNTIVLDPADGPVQAVTVQERVVTLTGFEGATERHSATLAVYIANGDSYVFADEVIVDVEGAFAGAELETFYKLTESQ